MKIATVLFTYNRSKHTKIVLNALKENTIRPEKLFIFQDGVKENTNLDEWNQVNQLIHSIDWCDTEVCVSEKNKGLRITIAGGINYALNDFDAVIVLEDDCVPHPLFMKYIISALEKYADNKRVFCIGGHTWPVNIENNGSDVYFTKRTSSSGWATWKDRWNCYEEDYYALSQIKKDSYLSEQYNIWGKDLELYLHGNLDGTCDAWDVFWSLTVLKQDGYCVAPYLSLIENIGYDGTGAHCGVGKDDVIMRDSQDIFHEFIFPEEIEIKKSTEEQFANHFSWITVGTKNKCYYDILFQWMQLHLKGKTINEYLKKEKITKVCIWGKGRVCDLLLQELDNNVLVQAIIESKPVMETYQGIQIVNPKYIPEDTQIIIVIPEYDIERIEKRLEYRYRNRIVKISDLMK